MKNPINARMIFSTDRLKPMVRNSVPRNQFMREFVAGKWPNLIIFDKLTDSVSEIDEWISENEIEIYFDQSKTFYFRNRTDAMAFKLTFNSSASSNLEIKGAA